MQYITLPQNKRLHQLINQLGLKDEKEALVREFSGIGATSSKQLLTQEAMRLIKHLEDCAANPEASQERAMRADKMRNKILSLAHEMRWELDGGRVDMKRVNEWCQARGFGKKDLNQYTYDELTKLVSQFKIVYTKYLTELSK
ncbi:hypothetical protein [Hymenobacter sp. B81]|uniref:hypothetical protein n=1 Tax=Hymenobacter sp. B81 TaxID=3344878 RepID=UPI0037DD0446